MRALVPVFAPWLAVVAIAAAAAFAPSPAHATTAAPGSPVVASGGGAAPGVGTAEDGPGGSVAAAGCGFFVRVLMSGLVVVGVIAGAIALCAWMFIATVFL